MKYKFEVKFANRHQTKYFKSRNKANNYLEKFLANARCQVEDVVIKNKHQHEFICSEYQRIFISRIN